jgi:endonuclease YncB( thermonuclease family)
VKRRFSLRRLCEFVLLALVLAVSFKASASDSVKGQASIIDGDTLEIHGTRIRLWGIDAPEHDQLCRGDDSLQYRCGAKAANELDAFIARRPVSCVPVSLDQYGRTVADCAVAGADLGEWLVRNGLALDWPQYSKGRYSEAQRDAEHAGRGIWAGSYVAPWLYRACIRAGSDPKDCSDEASPQDVRSLRPNATSGPSSKAISCVSSNGITADIEFDEITGFVKLNGLPLKARIDESKILFDWRADDGVVYRHNISRSTGLMVVQYGNTSRFESWTCKKAERKF